MAPAIPLARGTSGERDAATSRRVPGAANDAHTLVCGQRQRGRCRSPATARIPQQRLHAALRCRPERSASRRLRGPALVPDEQTRRPPAPGPAASHPRWLLPDRLRTQLRRPRPRPAGPNPRRRGLGRSASSQCRSAAEPGPAAAKAGRSAHQAGRRRQAPRAAEAGAHRRHPVARRHRQPSPAHPAAPTADQRSRGPSTYAAGRAPANHRAGRRCGPMPCRRRPNSTPPRRNSPTASASPRPTPAATMSCGAPAASMMRLDDRLDNRLGSLIQLLDENLGIGIVDARLSYTADFGGGSDDPVSIADWRDWLGQVHFYALPETGPNTLFHERQDAYRVELNRARAHIAVALLPVATPVTLRDAVATLAAALSPQPPARTPPQLDFNSRYDYGPTRIATLTSPWLGHTNAAAGAGAAGPRPGRGAVGRAVQPRRPACRADALRGHAGRATPGRRGLERPVRRSPPLSSPDHAALAGAWAYRHRSSPD